LPVFHFDALELIEKKTPKQKLACIALSVNRCFGSAKIALLDGGDF
jgi:hypothetical protein